MRADKYVSPFAPLLLGVEDEYALENVAQELVDELVQLYHGHIDNHRRVDPARWKRVRQRESVQVYSERRSFQIANGSQESDGLAAGASDPTELATLLALGTIPGTLDDALYGVAGPTIESMRLRTSYTQDNIEDAAVLTTITEPSTGHPFTSLTVKWSLIGRSSWAGTVSKKHDFVYLEATGVSELDGGERIGYQLIHSLSFPSLGELRDAQRGNLSLCCVYHEIAPETVELYMRGYFSPAGGLLRTKVIKSAAESMLSVCNIIYCAEMKKLAWAIRKRGLRDGGIGIVAICTSCHKHLRGSSPGRLDMCGICFQRLCKSCRISRRVSSMGQDRVLVQEQTSFCGDCLTMATHKSALAVARNELRAKGIVRRRSADSPRGPNLFPSRSLR